MYDLAIIGGGPAGVAAGVYASRKRLKTVFIAKDFVGQSVVSEGIENWIGTVKISGTDLAKKLEEHLRAYASDIVDIKVGETVQEVKQEANGGFVVKTDAGEYQTKTVLITAGSSRRRLTVPGAAELEHRGITYCASCDGPLFADMDVAVIGGGNAGFETAAQLLAYAKSVVLIHRNDEFKADPVTIKKVLSNPKMHAMLRTDIVEIRGGKFVTGLVYKNSETGEKKELSVQGIFVEIGSVPSTGFLGKLVALTPYSQIIVDPRTQRTSLSGIWAAGDVTDGLYHQNNIAAGDAVKALEDIYLYVHAK